MTFNGVRFMHWLLMVIAGHTALTLHCATLQADPYEGQLQWLERATGFDASLRGLSAVDDRVLWACGSKATVIRSSDGGEQWVKCGPSNLGELEIRSIIAFDDRTATIASAGTPAVIMQTHDGGQSWNEVFRHPSNMAFFDGLKFWDKRRGIAFSDPVDGRLLIATTADGGASWQVVAPEKLPFAREKEGGFAASNSALCVGPKGLAWIGTGGTVSAESRVYCTNDFGANWSISTCPLVSDTAAGIFSLAFRADEKLLIAVGGDYRPEAASKTTAAFSRDLGLTWQKAAQAPHMFVSAVCLEENRQDAQRKMISTGPTHSYQSDQGDYWQPFAHIGFHALDVSPSGRIFAVGSGGRFAELRSVQ